MARKSRKNMMPQVAVQEAVQQNEKELLRTAAYARLSVENGGHETEDSLHTQILQIHNYIRENPELTLTDTYADNGFTGTRFDRPEFERMMQDVRTGKIQCIVENAHEAIILKSDFEKVQARREQNKEKRERAMARSKATREKCYNHLSGMVYCGCCRRNMTFERRVHGTVKETHYGVFICKRKKNTTPCAYHAVPEKMLMMVAMDQIHHLVSTMCEEEKLVKDMMRGSNLDSARSIKMKENSILFRIQEAEERRLRLYEDYKAEILDEDEYSQLKEHYIAEKQRLEHELQKQRQRALELEKRIKICDAQMERMRGILNQNEFDEELVHELIKRIYVGMDNSVEVEFKCSDPYQEVLAIMSEVQNE